MDRFIARENIRHFRDRLGTETDPSIRSHLHKLLVEEEDRFGHDSEALDTIEAHIADGKVRRDRQQAVVASMQRNGHDTTGALALLNALSETLLIFEDRRNAILIALDRSEL